MTPPSVSVVIPVRNEAGVVRRALRSCLDQSYPALHEVVVVDGMSTDGTRDAALSEAAGDPRVSVIDNPARSTPSALNRGIAATSGAVIVRCDAHAELPQGYVAQAVDQLVTTGAANVGGIQRAVGITPIQRAIARAMSSPLGVGDARYRYGGRPGPTDTVYLGVFDRAALERVGGFDETLIRNQDYELNYRLRASGETVWFDPTLEVVYIPRSSLRTLARQYFDYGVGKVRMLRKHPRAMRWRQLAPPTFVAGLAGSAFAAVFGAVGAAVVVPVLYAGALTIGTILEVIRSPDPALILFPAAVATMHLTWGAGFIVELFGLGPQAAPR